MKLLHLSHNVSAPLFLPSCATFSLAGLGQRHKLILSFSSISCSFCHLSANLSSDVGLGGSVQIEHSSVLEQL